LHRLPLSMGTLQRATGITPSATETTYPTREPLKVLIAEDDPEFRQILAAAVRQLGHSCAVAGDGLEAWEMHQLNRADVILSDWKMPTMDGLNLCRKIRSTDPPHSYTHVILLTGQNDKAHFVEGMEAGADDYLTKPLDLDQLKVHLEATRRVMTVHQQLAESNSVLRRDSEREFQAARTDPLTDISNRLRLMEDLEALPARVLRYGHRYCAALCDIDGFKAYNDCFGHLSGDDALRRVARVMHEQLRRSDGLYRYGGEEFLVILPEQSLAEAAVAMDRIRRAVEALGIPHAPAMHPSVLTISVGIAELNGGLIDGWLRRADAALYVAKSHGRNRLEVEAAGVS
jgi:two-component system cell cycle response regulator